MLTITMSSPTYT